MDSESAGGGWREGGAVEMLREAEEAAQEDTDGCHTAVIQCALHIEYVSVSRTCE